MRAKSRDVKFWLFFYYFAISQERRDKMIGLKEWICSFVGAIGSGIALLLGGWNTDLTTLLIFMAVDFILGLAIAAIWKRSGKSETGALNSISAWKGLMRKGASLLVVLVAYRLDLTLGVDYIRTAVIIAFIANEGLSIVENLGIMGIPLPKQVTKAIDVLKNKED